MKTIRLGPLRQRACFDSLVIMFEITIRDKETGRSVVLEYSKTSDLTYRIEPDPKEAMVKTFGVYQLDDIEEFLCRVAEDLETWYKRIDNE